MPETPDFDHLARTMRDRARERDAGLLTWESDLFDDLAEQLRVIWNARGAADVAKIEAELTAMMGGTAGGPYVKNLDRALRKLDR